MMKNQIGLLIGLLVAYLLTGCRSAQVTPAATAGAVPITTPASRLTAEPVSGPAQLLLTITGNPNPIASPNDLEVDREGNLYVLDSLNNRLQKFDPDGTFLAMWGTGGQNDGEFKLIMPDNGSGVGAVAVDGAGNVYVADWGNHRIQKFDREGLFLTKWGSQGKGDGQFFNLISITADREGNVYVLDGLRMDVQKFDNKGQFLAKWGSKGSEDGQFSFPTYLTADSQGNIYVVDGFNNRIQKFDSNGQFLTKWGSKGTGDGQFSFISGEYGIGLGAVAADDQGNVYVADYGNNRIQKFDGKGQFLAKWGTAGSGDDQFIHPVALAVDPEGNVYVADFGNNRIQKFRQL